MELDTQTRNQEHIEAPPQSEELSLRERVEAVTAELRATNRAFYGLHPEVLQQPGLSLQERRRAISAQLSTVLRLDHDSQVLIPNESLRCYLQEQGFRKAFEVISFTGDKAFVEEEAMAALAWHQPNPLVMTLGQTASGWLVAELHQRHEQDSK